MGFFEAVDTSIAPLAQNLSHRAARHSAIAANIANVDTPGFKAVDVRFKKELDAAGTRMARTHSGHLGASKLAGSFDVVELSGPARRDGNSVNIDNEMVKLAENQIDYRFLTRMLRGKFNKIKEAITGRAQA